MSLFFKLSKDGKFVYVARTLFANKVGERTFEEKAKKITVEEFLSKMPKSRVSKIEENIKELEKLNERKPSMFGCIPCSNPTTRTTSFVYLIGDRRFTEDYGEQDEFHDKEDAFSYGAKFYGKEFMEKNKSILDNRNVAYFAGDQQISRDEYDCLKEKEKKLTSIVRLNELEKTKTKNI